MVEKRDFAYPPCIRRPLGGGSRRNTGTPFSEEKLEWCRYPMVKKFRRYVYSFWRDPRTWRTDRQTDTAWQQRPRLCIASRDKNRLSTTLQCSNEFLKSPFQQGTWQLTSKQSLAIIYNLHIRSLKQFHKESVYREVQWLYSSFI